MVKPWLADLAVLGFNLAGSIILSYPEQVDIAHSLILSPSHHPDMTEILLKRKQAIYRAQDFKFKDFLQKM